MSCHPKICTEHDIHITNNNKRYIQRTLKDCKLCKQNALAHKKMLQSQYNSHHLKQKDLNIVFFGTSFVCSVSKRSSTSLCVSSASKQGSLNILFFVTSFVCSISKYSSASLCVSSASVCCFNYMRCSLCLICFETR